MTITELFGKYEKDIENMNFEDIDEFKKFADEEDVTYSEGELKQGWAHLSLRNVYEDKSFVDEDALLAVAGGQGGEVISSIPAPIINVNYYDCNIVKAGGDIKGNVNIASKK